MGPTTRMDRGIIAAIGIVLAAGLMNHHLTIVAVSVTAGIVVGRLREREARAHVYMLGYRHGIWDYLRRRRETASLWAEIDRDIAPRV